MLASQRIGAPASSAPRAAATTPGVAITSRVRSVWPHAWIIRTTTVATSGANAERSDSARIVAKD